ncbi:MAG: glutamate 5-kinase [Mycobacteriales bacterium]|jgi:glutamate 5-kinase
MLTDTSTTTAGPALSVLAAGRPAGGTTPGDRVVLKIGTSSLVTGGQVDPVKVDRLADTVHEGIRAGLAPVLVTSGAIAVGRTRHPALAGGDPVAQQVAAAVGQGVLYSALQTSFAERGLVAGQLLLTPFDLVELERNAGVGGTLATMLALGLVPIVNENDALGVRNNDVLAAVLSGFLRARLLLLLTNVSGLYDSNPLLGGAATHIASVPRLTPELEAVAGGSVGDGGTGGMTTKLSASWIATYAGVRTVIADTTDPGVLVAAARGDQVGTVFQPRPVTAAPDLGRLWRAFRMPPRGTLGCDAAGLRAIARGRPVLRGHVTRVRGPFRTGEVVDLAGADARPVARGAVRLDSAAAEAAGPASSTLVAEHDYVQIVED